MYRVLAAELTIWSMACMAKLKVMNSHFYKVSNPAEITMSKAPGKIIPQALVH